MPSLRATVVVGLAFTGLLLISAVPVRAHCDTLNGPVVKTARAALETKDLRPLLKWVKPPAEQELREAFERALSVRSQGAGAKELADRYFLETVVRLHRAGEGAPYTGLKAEADDPAGLIAASDRALEARSLDGLAAPLVSSINAALRERYDRVIEARRHADETTEAGRRYVEAYVEYVHFVEALQGVVAPAGHGGEKPHGHDR